MPRLKAAPHPFRVATVDRVYPVGYTLAQMIEQIELDPVQLAHAHVWIGDNYIPRENWRLVRPIDGTFITLRVLPQGGGGGGGKNPLRTVLTIAVIAASFYFGPALGLALAPAGATALTPVFGSLTYGALGGAIISIAGTLLINVIAPIRPPRLPELSGTSTTRDSPTLFIEGARNQLRPFGTVPVVLGTNRMFPPLGAKSFTEIIGDDNYLRVLIVWGYGPLDIQNIRIGETPIDQFDGVQIETREGRVGDPPLTLFPNVVLQDDFSILLTQVSDWQTRTAQPNADELSVDVTFPNGLVRFNDQGGRGAWSVSAEIEYRAVGDVTWLTPTYSATTVPAEWISGSTVTFTQNRTSAIRHGFRWSVPRGNYEVRIRRTTSDSTDTQIFDTFAWTALRIIRDEDPIAFPFPVAKTALIIKATDQLNRAVDELNAVVSGYVQSFTGGSPPWVEAVSSNPADIYRHVLQGYANASRLTDGAVDVDKLEEWHSFCAANGFEFNMVRDFQASVWDTLADVSSAGRASPAQIDGKWSVVYDYEQSIPVQHFTPRNSWGFEAEKGFPDQPDAFRIRFSNRNEDWRQDERIVYADGFNAGNAEKFDAIEAPGITDPAHIWKHGRFQLAQAILRPERWSFNVDFEYMVCRRGDLIVVTHDVLLVGLASGRIKELQYDGNSPPNVTGFTSDEVLPMESGKNYGVSIRTVDDASLVRQIVTDPGDQTTVVFSTPIPPNDAPSVGDLFGFGEIGLETIEGIVLSIEPTGELSAKLTCIPASPAVYSSDTGTIPPFDSKLTPLAEIDIADILTIRSDESVLQLGSGNTIVPHIAITLQSPIFRGVTSDVQIRSSATGEPFYNANIVSVQGGDYLIGNIEQGKTYDIRVRWRATDRLPGAWTNIFNHTVIGQTNPPAALINPTISVFGGNALIRWDRPSELDVRFGGEVRFRHSPEIDPTLAEWQASTSIGTAAKGDALFASLPLKPGTYLARVFDKGGRPSDVIVLATKQASVLAFANVDSVTESPVFLGTKNNVIGDGGTLRLTGTGLFDDIIDLDVIQNLDAFGGLSAFGVYTFAGGFDLSTVTRVRLTSLIDAININIFDLIDGRDALIDAWEDFDGTEASAADARIQVRQTDDDPGGSPVDWTVWNDLDSAEFDARGFEFRCILTTNDPAYNISISQLGVVAEEI